MGEVTFTQGPRGLLIQASVCDLVAGPRVFQIPVAGSCTPEFGATGGQFNPVDTGHHVLRKGGHHAGDLPIFVAHPDGAGLADRLRAPVPAALGWRQETVLVQQPRERQEKSARLEGEPVSLEAPTQPRRPVQVGDRGASSAVSLNAETTTQMRPEEVIAILTMSSSVGAAN